MKLLIVDDESQDRASIARICATHANIESIAEADSGAAAIDVVQRLQPDVLLLNVALPDMSGFEVLRVAQRYDQHSILLSEDSEQALEAFEVGVDDYLLKPVNANRLMASLDRAARSVLLKGSLTVASPQSRILTEFDWTYNASPPVLVGEREHRFYPLEPRDIEYIESEGNYVKLYAEKLAYITRNSIKRLTEQLVTQGFVRIERSLLLNVRAVAFAEAGGQGTFAFTLHSGKQLRSSATYRRGILTAMPFTGASCARVRLVGDPLTKRKLMHAKQWE